MLDPNAFGRLLRESRFRVGLRMSDVAGELDHSNAYINYIETGRQIPLDHHALDRIAEVYDIDPIEVHAKAIESSAAARGEVRLDVGDPPSEQGLLAVELAQHWTNMQPSTAKALLLILRGRES